MGVLHVASKSVNRPMTSLSMNRNLALPMGPVKGRPGAGDMFVTKRGAKEEDGAVLAERFAGR